MIARPASGPTIDAPECVACGADLVERDVEVGFCRECQREMDREQRADQERDEPNERAERHLRMLEEE